MPKRAPSGIKGLHKQHQRGCVVQREHPEQCACSWRGKYKGHSIALANWAGVEVDPHSVTAGASMLERMKNAIDAGVFNRPSKQLLPANPQNLLTGLLPVLSEADIATLAAIASLMRQGRHIAFTVSASPSTD